MYCILYNVFPFCIWWLSWCYQRIGQRLPLVPDTMLVRICTLMRALNGAGRLAVAPRVTGWGHWVGDMKVKLHANWCYTTNAVAREWFAYERCLMQNQDRIQKVSIGFVVAETNAGNIATTELWDFQGCEPISSKFIQIPDLELTYHRFRIDPVSPQGVSCYRLSQHAFSGGQICIDLQFARAL